MAFIKAFDISGLAGRKEAYSQELNRDINVFFGGNGVGKTTLLRVLCSAIQNKPNLLDRTSFNKATVLFHSSDYDVDLLRTARKPSKNLHSSRASITAGMSDLARDQLMASPEHIYFEFDRHGERALSWLTKAIDGKEPPKLDNPFGCTYLPVSRLYASALADVARVANVGARPSSTIAEPELEASFARNIRALWKSYSNFMLREVGDAQQQGLSKILLNVLSKPSTTEQTSSGDPEAAYQLAKAFLARQPGSLGAPVNKRMFLNMYQKHSYLRAVIGDIEDIETKIEDVRQPSNELARLLHDLFAQNGKKVTVTPDDIIVSNSVGDTIPLELLSSGEKQIIKLCVEALNCKGILIIDEPEISLHIGWQRKLLHTLKFLKPDLQIIVATHSPEIMADVDDSQIFRL